jgi:Kinesin motor domain
MQFIAKSLAAFTHCLHALVRRATPVVRKSRLTYILSSLLTGHGRLVIAAHVSCQPDKAECTRRTLEAAQRWLPLETRPGGPRAHSSRRRACAKRPRLQVRSI